jgi:dihydrofolate reductase
MMENLAELIVVFLPWPCLARIHSRPIAVYGRPSNEKRAVTIDARICVPGERFGDYGKQDVNFSAQPEVFPGLANEDSETTMPGYRFEGHAIVSVDDRIADASGQMPKELCHPVDQARFQTALDEAALVVLGRRSHEAVPNRRGRNRLVMSRSVDGLTNGRDAWWWNPIDVPLEDVLRQTSPGGGTVAVPGGREVFDYFLAAGFDAFHLSTNAGVRLPGGAAIFSECDNRKTASMVLRGAGLSPRTTEWLDIEDKVSLTVWRAQEVSGRRPNSARHGRQREAGRAAAPPVPTRVP